MKNPQTIVANLPCGAGGGNSNLNTYRVPISELVKFTNIRYDNQAIAKAPGAVPLGTAIAGAPTCLGAASFFPNAAGEATLSAWDDGHIYKEASNQFGSVDLGSFGATTVPVVMVPFSMLAESGSTVANRMAFFAQGTTPTTVVGTGSSFTAFTTASSDWSGANAPSGGCLPDFRLAAFGVNDYPHNVYFSTLTDLTVFSGAGSKVMSVYPGEGQKIVAARSYRETLLAVFKYPRGIYLIDTEDLTLPVNPAYRLTNEVGGAGPNALTDVNGDIWFISDQGHIHSLTQVQENIDPKQSNISHTLNLTEFIRRNVDLSRLKWSRLHFDKLRQEVIYSFTSKVSVSTNDTSIIIKLPTQTQPASWSIDRRGYICNATWGRIGADGDHEVLCAGEGGKVLTFNDITSAYEADGVAYQSVFAHPVTDFSYMDPRFAGIEKHFKFLYLQFLPTFTESTFYVDIYVDNEFKRTESCSLLDSSSNVYDTATYDSSTYAAENELFYRTLPLDVMGRKIQFVCYNNTAGEAFVVTDMTVTFELADADYEEVA